MVSLLIPLLPTLTLALEAILLHLLPILLSLLQVMLPLIEEVVPPQEAVMVVLLPTLLNPLQVMVSLVERVLLLLLMLPLEAAGVVLLPIPLGSLEVVVYLIKEAVRLILPRKVVVVMLLLTLLSPLEVALPLLRLKKANLIITASSATRRSLKKRKAQYILTVIELIRYCTISASQLGSLYLGGLASLKTTILPQIIMIFPALYIVKSLSRCATTTSLMDRLQLLIPKKSSPVILVQVLILDLFLIDKILRLLLLRLIIPVVVRLIIPVVLRLIILTVLRLIIPAALRLIIPVALRLVSVSH
jgi:hypothetical protein